MSHAIGRKPQIGADPPGLGVAVAIGATQYWRVLGPILDADVWLVSGAFAEVVAFIVTVIVARSGIRAGGGVQFRDLTTQAEKTVAQGQRTASQLENETKLLTQNAEKEVGNITNKAAAAADLVYSQHSAMRNVRELIERGDLARWAAVAPIIERSPEAQRGVYDAVRQVIADEATSKKALQRFNETIRPALTRFNMITTAQADDIAKQLAEISTYRATEPEKLSLMRRMVLQGLAGAAASNTSSLVGRIILPTPPNNLAPENQNALAQ